MRKEQGGGGSGKKAGGEAGKKNDAGGQEEKKEQPKTSKSPFRSSASQSQTKDGILKSGTPEEEEIEEDIIQDHEEINLQPNSARDGIGTSGGAGSSSAVGIDQSIDTLNLNEFDYVEEVKTSPRDK